VEVLVPHSNPPEVFVIDQKYQPKDQMAAPSSKLPAVGGKSVAAAPRVNIPDGFVEVLVPHSNPPEVFVIDQKYQPKDILGKGSYGLVCSANDTKQPDPKKPSKPLQVAIKKVGKDIFHNLEDAKRIVREIKLLKFLKNENIITVLDFMGDVQKDFDDIYIVMPMMATDLHKTIYSDNALTDDHCKYFMWQMLRGLKYMHSASVIHRDLKPANVLLDENCDLKICDFGLARGVLKDNIDPALTEVVITRWYRAPEVILAPSAYDFKVDIWSLGCILGEILGRKTMFPGKDYMEQINYIFDAIGSPAQADLGFVAPHALKFLKTLQPKRKISFAAKYPKASAEAIDLLDKLLTFNPSKRPSADEALQHPYFAAYRRQLAADGHTLPVAPAPVDFSWEATVDVNDEKCKSTIRDLLYEEMFSYRPALKSLFKAKWHKDGSEPASAAAAAKH
jgi:serine/threonine protein kinase